MDPSIPPLIAVVTLILTAGGVLVLRPISSRLGELIELMVAERRRPGAGDELAEVRTLLDGIDRRLANLEERQEFAEALLSSGRDDLFPGLPPEPN